jgi:prepilin-type N-terminal cleavage/methylation domain-containing protein
MYLLKNNENNEKEKGFSLMELLVVIALLTVLLSMTLFNYDQFGKETELENSVYSVALAIRETQTFGINKKARDGLANPQDFGEDYGYGVHFRRTTLTGSENIDTKHFAFFIDSNGGDKKMTGNCSPSQECYSVVSIEKGNYISNIRVSGTGA